jgi:hypothetical protein
MFTVEQYISKIKKKDKLDEFNFQNRTENMTTVIKYVMDYFYNYLNPEAYDYENITVEQTLLHNERWYLAINKLFAIELDNKNSEGILI